MTSSSDPILKSISKLRDELRTTLEKTVDSTMRSITDSHFPLLDIYETEKEIVLITAPVDGLIPSTVDIIYEAGVLTISGTTQDDKPVSKETYLLRERSFGPFSRTIAINSAIEPEEATANVKARQITVTLPKAQTYTEITGIQIAE